MRLDGFWDAYKKNQIGGWLNSILYEFQESRLGYKRATTTRWLSSEQIKQNQAFNTLMACSYL